MPGRSRGLPLRSCGAGVGGFARPRGYLRHRKAQADARAPVSLRWSLASARNPCRHGLHSYKAATRESTRWMLKNEKFAEALRFFIRGDMHALRGCHTSEACGYREQRAAGLSASLARHPADAADEAICGCVGRRPRCCACPDASRAVTRTCRDVSLSGSLDQVTSSRVCSTDRRS